MTRATVPYVIESSEDTMNPVAGLSFALEIPVRRQATVDAFEKGTSVTILELCHYTKKKKTKDNSELYYYCGHLMKCF